jgi:hypothetical protein
VNNPSHVVDPALLNKYLAIQIADLFISIPTVPSNFVKSLAIMNQGSFGRYELSATPHTGLKNLPSFLIGVPLTNTINNTAYACAFNSGPIYACGFRTPVWNDTKFYVELVYSGFEYDGNFLEVINQNRYMYFPSPTFNISSNN